MTSDDAWQALLSDYNRALLAAPTVRTALPPRLVAAGWLGAPGASTAAIESSEARLGTPLPPSYRAFLTTSNGWTYARQGSRLLAVEDIDWLEPMHLAIVEGWIEGRSYDPGPPISDAEYFVYGPEQQPYTMRDDYLRTALCVSDPEASELYLLNPRIVTPEGEWEAWFFADWLAGARRYRSFWDLMREEYREFVARQEADEDRPHKGFLTRFRK